MSHHHHPHQEEKSYAPFYLVALITGLFVGAIIDRGLIYIPIGGVLGLLTAALFVNKVVKGRENV
ncbi:MAG: hypothetical protein EOP51_16355 [Sphingobacteriales bacterium]|nr:MAG: hypothetical protein EOP51_16355 [Sphingobacteriales bacterium]